MQLSDAETHQAGGSVKTGRIIVLMLGRFLTNVVSVQRAVCRTNRKNSNV